MMTNSNVATHFAFGASHSRPLSEAHPRTPSVLATMMAYFIVIYIYSSAAWVVMLLYPAVKVAYVLYLLLATLPFLLAVNRSTVRVFYDHWPFALLIAVYFFYISAQYALLGMADIPAVRESYFEKGQFLAGVLASLVAFELSFSFRNLLRILYLVVIASCAINLVEFFDPAALPMQFTTVPGRAAGFYFNPNVSAMFIASAVPLLGSRMNQLGRIIFYGITGIGTLLTFSRGGWALWFVAVVITEVAQVNWKTFRFTSGNLGLLAAGAIGAILLIVALGPAYSLLVGGLSTHLDTNTAGRLEMFANETTMDRLELARQGLVAFADAPLFGKGVGYTWQWEFGLSVHNMFVLMLAEQGIVGFLWLLALLVVWWRYPRPYGWWLVVLFCVSAVATHNYFDGALPAVLIALYLAASFKFGATSSNKESVMGILPT